MQERSGQALLSIAHSPRAIAYSVCPDNGPEDPGKWTEAQQ
jgi:hypothetical protein